MDEHDGHRNRLRQRVLEKGLEELRPLEVMEFLVSYSVPRQDTARVARLLLEHFGDVRHVMRATQQELENLEGVGCETAVWLAKLGEIASICAWAWENNTVFLDNYAHVFRYVLRLGRQVRPPASYQLLTDMDSRLIFRRCITPSLSWGEAETLRGALSDACTSHAKGAILALYAGHPVFGVDPYDVERAKAYSYTLNAAGTALLDVIIVGTDSLISLRSLGHIPSYGKRGLLRSLREDYQRGMPAPENLRMQDYCGK